jgi:hypothetical protein
MSKRPEVQFARFLRDRYPSTFHVVRKSRWEEGPALALAPLDANGDGILTASEKKRVTIIYEHNWGWFANRDVGSTTRPIRHPVRLTIQIDSVGKLWQSDSRISANVDRVINFYQSAYSMGNPQSARPDPDQTNILGNFRITKTATMCFGIKCYAKDGERSQ